MTLLYLCINQSKAITPYEFINTKIKIYSIEEAFYHVYHYWYESIDEFVSEKFINWVQKMSSQVAATLKEIALLQTARERMLSFLSINSYYCKQDLEQLEQQLLKNEYENNWKQYKETGDYYVSLKRPSKAIEYYKQALDYFESMELLNNLGVALMNIGRYSEAIKCYEKALKFKPSSNQKDSILLNLAEAAIHNNNLETALKSLENLTSKTKTAQAYYLYGEIDFKMVNLNFAIENYKKAYQINADVKYIYRMVDVYVKLKLFPSAFEILDSISFQTKEFFKKKAWVFELSGRIPNAIKTIEASLMQHKEDPELWTLLAKYHRLDYDLNMAKAAITKALTISRLFLPAKLEHARIKKASGELSEYHEGLRSVLSEIKQKYFELN